LKKGISKPQPKKNVTLPEPVPETINRDIDEILEKEKADTLERQPKEERKREHPDVLSEAHWAEKYYELFDENKRLKVFQDQLNKDIEILKNRLTYIKEKMVKRTKLSGDSTGKEFELIDENTLLREENKKLRTILKSKVPRESENSRPNY